jgi:hypothetical protein
MAALLLLMAMVGGMVVGDLVLDNATTEDLTLVNHAIHGVSEGLLLVLAAAAGVVVGRPVVASASVTRNRVAAAMSAGV